MNALNNKRIFSVEFLRIWAIIFIFIGHIGQRYPEEIKLFSQYIFGVEYNNWWMGVELFFVIGGFFLFKRANSTTSPYLLIKKTWLRLIPGMLFAFAICTITANVGLFYLPSVLLLLGGTAMHAHVLAGGDWFIGAYFWISCLIICLFCSLSRRSAFLVLGILVYLAITIKINATVEKKGAWLDTYYTFIGTGICRGIYCMGLGVAAGLISENILFSRNWLSRIV